jgi:alcohol dehydrogenase
MDKVIANELEIIGSHGIQAHRYGTILEMIQAGKLNPSKLIHKTISLDEAPEALTTMDQFKGIGITVIDQFK